MYTVGTFCSPALLDQLRVCIFKGVEEVIVFACVGRRPILKSYQSCFEVKSNFLYKIKGFYWQLVVIVPTCPFPVIKTTFDLFPYGSLGKISVNEIKRGDNAR